jgi:hypothetical protein
VSGKHRDDGGEHGPVGAAPHVFVPRRIRFEARTWWWIASIVAAGGILILLVASTLLPYRPFSLYSYVITPERVCAGAPVRNMVTREFTAPLNYFQLSESWTTVDVPGFPADRPISTESAELPAATLTQGMRRTVPSPLLTAAPAIPGVYRVRITTQASGTRFGFVPAIGSDTFESDNQVTVLDCPPTSPPPTGENP